MTVDGHRNGKGNVAAIDCGTHSTRLLIADAQGRTLERRTTITKLGEGVDRTKRITPAAIERVATTLTDYRGRLDHHGVDDPTDIRITATSAARDATNADELFGAIATTTRAIPELLTGEEEGRLSFRGATAELDPAKGPYLVVDIGGGSTEFVVGHAGQEPTGITSIDVGCVRLTERYIEGDPPDAGGLSDALSVVRIHLDDVVRDVPNALDAARLVVLAGTVTTVAAIELGLIEYDRERIHHSLLTKAAAEDVFRTVATESARDRAGNPGLEPDRVDVIVAGSLILVAVLRYFDFDECLVSESDILDGLVMSLLDRRS